MEVFLGITDSLPAAPSHKLVLVVDPVLLASWQLLLSQSICKKLYVRNHVLCSLDKVQWLKTEPSLRKTYGNKNKGRRQHETWRVGASQRNEFHQEWQLANCIQGTQKHLSYSGRIAKMQGPCCTIVCPRLHILKPKRLHLLTGAFQSEPSICKYTARVHQCNHLVS